MTQPTTIEWTEASWNPVRGCTRVSEGCRHCYAESLAGRFIKPGLAYEGLAKRTATGPRWTGVVRFIEKQLKKPLHRRKPTFFFANSMSDVFHEKIPLEHIRSIFDVMERAKQHTFQLLTKRSTRLRELSSQLPWPPNVWMGVSVEGPKYLHRIDDLRASGASVKFVSMEPLLAPFESLDLMGTHWVIVGGESGQHLLKADVRRERALVERVGGTWVPRGDRIDWVRGIRDACEAQGVPFFFKQWGGLRPKSAGRMLDGVLHDAMPARRRSLPVI